MTLALGVLAAAIAFVGVAIVGAGRRIAEALMSLVDVLEAARTK